MNILALDVASNCGFAITTSKPGSYVSGTWNLSPKKDESKGMRLIRFRSKLNELKSTEPIGLVVFESAVSYGAKHASGVTVQAEMLGVLKLWCEDNGIEYKGYAPKEIKKHATGKGNANKEMMLSAARRAFGESVKDDNEADALWLLRLATTDLANSWFFAAEKEAEATFPNSAVAHQARALPQDNVMTARLLTPPAQ